MTGARIRKSGTGKDLCWHKAAPMAFSRCQIEPFDRERGHSVAAEAGLRESDVGKTEVAAD